MTALLVLLAVISHKVDGTEDYSLSLSISVTRLCSLAVGEFDLSTLPKYAPCMKFSAVLWKKNLRLKWHKWL